MNSCKEGRASTERTDYQPKTRSASLLPAPRRARRQPGSQYWPTRAAARASIADKPRAYLPRLATYDASKPFIDDAKTVLTRRAPYCQLSQTARSLATRSLAAQEGSIRENTRSENRLRNMRLESHPEFEAQAGPTDSATRGLLAAFSEPWSIAAASPRITGTLTRGSG